MNRLNRAIAWYNAIREGSHETEVALIEKEISAIDHLLGRGVEELTWNDDCKFIYIMIIFIIFAIAFWLTRISLNWIVIFFNIELLFHICERKVLFYKTNKCFICGKY